MAHEPVDIYHDAYLRVTLEHDGAFVRMRRTTAAFPTIESMRTSYAQVRATYERIGQTGRGLLVDGRDAPGRNDPAFEQAMAEVRVKADAGFARVAIVMRTAVGKLQSQRYARQDGRERLVTDDEDEAIAYLLGSRGRPAQT